MSDEFDADRRTRQDSKDISVLSASLNMATAWVKFLLEAYDALLHHGINYRALPSFKDPNALLEVALDKNKSFKTGVAAVLSYLERLTNDIRAAVRRKSFKQV